MQTHTVICQKWMESERGWGQRPDGYSLHLTEADLASFIAAYWANMPNTAPDEYSAPDGTPYKCKVDSKTYERISKSENGIRLFDENEPCPHGPDGWRSMQCGNCDV